MLLNSFNFWIIFPFIFIVYWLVPSRYVSTKKWILIIVSYLLYMNFKPAYALILLGVTLITYICALILDNLKNKKKRKNLLWTGTILAILPLLVFKYYNFINVSIYQLMETMGLRFHLSGLNMVIPLGISFFTFQALGYLFDVYYFKIKVERNFTDYLLFCSFFPQTASGPISKASELLPQIKKNHPFNYNQAREGLQTLLWGMFLKVVVADRLGIYVDTVFGNYEHYSGLTCFVASVFYSFQIYGDFAGYSLMAIGISKILGYDLINNFNRPYLANNITDFWKRWHISLTRWLTPYIYIPLGGNRCTKLRQYWNIMITFIVSGIWHGANWNYIIWGVLHGFFQIIEKAFGLDPKGKLNNKIESKNFNIITSCIIKILRIIITFLLVNFAWIFFRMPTIESAWNVIVKILFNSSGLWEDVPYKPITITFFIIIIGHEIFEEFFPGKLPIYNNKCSAIRWASYLFLMAFIILYGVLDSTQFIYVSF